MLTIVNGILNPGKKPIMHRRREHFRFGFELKKTTKPILFFFEKKPKPNRNRVKPTSFGPVRFGFLFQKTEHNLYAK